MISAVSAVATARPRQLGEELLNSRIATRAKPKGNMSWATQTGMEPVRIAPAWRSVRTNWILATHSRRVTAAATAWLKSVARL